MQDVNVGQLCKEYDVNPLAPASRFKTVPEPKPGQRLPMHLAANNKKKLVYKKAQAHKVHTGSISCMFGRVVEMLHTHVYVCVYYVHK